MTRLEPGERVEVRRAFSMDDLLAFSRLSGDDDPIHTDPDYARTTAFGRPIAHGALVMGLLSAAAAAISRRSLARGSPATPVSAGYDRLRFTGPVFAEEEVVASYVVEAVDDPAGRSLARVEVRGADGTLRLVGRHVMRWVAGPGGGA